MCRNGACQSSLQLLSVCLCMNHVLIIYDEICDYEFLFYLMFFVYAFTSRSFRFVQKKACRFSRILNSHCACNNQAFTFMIDDISNIPLFICIQFHKYIECMTINISERKLNGNCGGVSAGF